MGDFNRRSSGGRNFGKHNFGGRGADRPMHRTICSKCAKQCEVPFIPSGSRPVFCSECFQNNRASDPIISDNNYRQVNRPAQPQYREQFEALNTKLDKILKMLEPKIVPAIISAEIPIVPGTSKGKKAAKKSTPTKKKQ